MERVYVREFEKRIYEYCDNNVGQKVLFTGFEYLWPPNHDVAPKDLAILTSRILNELAEKGILREIRKEGDFDVPYGMYKILPHKKLIKK
jgi:hypothetical protein